MAQGKPNLTDCIPAPLRLLEHQTANGGENDGEGPSASLSGPQGRISRLWDFDDPDRPHRSEPVNLVAGTSSTGVDGPCASLSRADDLTEADIGNLNSVLDHEIAHNTMKNYSAQWKSFVAWSTGKGTRALPAEPGQVAAYLAERIEEHGHKPATLRAAAAAIGFFHRTAGQDDPCASPEVKRTLRSATRKAGRRQKQADGLTAEALTAIRSMACNPPPGTRRQVGEPRDR